MRMLFFSILLLLLTGTALAADAKALKDNDRYTCAWGAGTAERAQELKLSGVSLYAARQKIQTLKFDKSWKRMLAMRITEQTYDSKSRYKPAAVREIFYNDCVHYKVAAKSTHR